MLVKKIDEKFLEMKCRLQDTFQHLNYVTVTADCWSSHHRHFLGVTALWLEPDSLDRKIATLACRRMVGSVTYDKLALEMSNIFEEYGIQGKVTKVITDNGSNFIKAFQCYGGNAEEAADEPDTYHRDLSSLLDGEDSMVCLPPHHRCAAHTLNLIATTDAARANMDPEYSKASTSVFKKCSAIWNKQGQSVRAADIVKSYCGIYLTRPVATRWNSYHEALECILRLVNEGKDINGLCRALNVPVFQRGDDFKFIEEYCTVMSPLCAALDILQGDKYIFLGYLLPTITVLIRRLEYEGMKGLKFCRPLVTAVLDGIQKRFGHLMEDKELLLAAAVLPRFKLSWLKDVTQHAAVMDMLRREIANNSAAKPRHTPVVVTRPRADDFFAFGDAVSASESTACTEDDELTEYLRIPEDYDISKMKTDFPRVQGLFLRVNTAVPSSASVERLFSTAADVFTRKRTKLTDVNFEKQLLLKCNAT
ncbi:uncharacterized protein LOC135400142 [Ornithodoros turicata]